MTDRQFVHRVALASLVVVVFAAVSALLLRYPFVPLLAFAGVLGGIVLDALSRPLQRLLPRGVAIASVALASLALLGAAIWLYGPRAIEQVAELVQRMPRSIAALGQELPAPAEGEVIDAVSQGAGQLDWQSLAPVVFGSVAGLFTTAVGAATGAIAAFVLAIFLALDPGLYLRGLLRLVPREGRARGREVLCAIANALRWWLVGRCVAMAIVAIVTFAGLALLGVPQALALALLAGVLTFVPYAGPVLASLPALLVAASVSLTTTAWTLALYVGIQLLENNVLTPIVEGRAVSLPPALVIVAGVLLAVVFGALGVLLSTPLTIALVVLVQAFYVEDALGDPVPLLGEDPEPAREARGR
jgi:predicted PurR-regulated permease PerM